LKKYKKEGWKVSKSLGLPQLSKAKFIHCFLEFEEVYWVSHDHHDH